MNFQSDVGGQELLSRVENLWIKLRDYHAERSSHFGVQTKEITYEHRVKDIMRRCGEGGVLRIEILKTDDKDIGYCVAVLNAEREGEIESLYIEQEYRGEGGGKLLMDNAMDWLNYNGAEKIGLSVMLGNESVLDFYRRWNFYPRSLRLERIP